MDENTNYPNGLTSYGIPMVGTGVIPVTNSNYWFVDGTNGNDGNTGHGLKASLKTIKAANAQALANDVILVMPGTYTEAVVLSAIGLRILGLGTSVKSVQWTSATDTITASMTANFQEIGGFYFKPPTFTAGTPTAIQFGNANYAYVHDNRFQGQTGSYNAIYSPVCNSDNVKIIGNNFEYMNTLTNGAAILGVEAGGLSYSNWQIKNNLFNSCVTEVNINGRVCLVQGNHFNINGITAAGAGGAVCTLALDLSGTSSYGNAVHGNYLGGAYSATLYKVGASGDDWAGNFNIAGITTANPA